MDANITLFLNLAQHGDSSAENHVFQFVYEKLRAIAGALLRGERSGHTLQATALVSEAFLQKLRHIAVPIQSREHYYSIAACAMRQVLIDHARRFGTDRRRLSSEVVAELLNINNGTARFPELRLAVQQAFRVLCRIDPQVAKSLQARFVAGLTIRQTALHFNQPEWKVRADCDFALNWMAERLGGSQ